MSKQCVTMTMAQAVAALLGPIMANSARLVDEGDPDAVLVIEFLGRRHDLTLRALQDLDRAYTEAFDRAQRRACARRERKSVGRLL